MLLSGSGIPGNSRKNQYFWNLRVILNISAGIRVTGGIMADAVSPDKVADLEERIETLELLVDEEFREKIEEGLEDEQAGRVIPIKEYEEEHGKA